MLLTIVLSAAVSFLVSLATAAAAFHSIDRYVQGTTEALRASAKALQSAARQTDLP